ncbi:uncharacterized protein DUF4192 [Nocardioides albertanoniae]|uniref:Uncharacterized protein DUF4192 n=1 Tax=Nocardioides albertanoniae TaxID=1175486 RepID=A0A543A959_9ACTN|nr:DUF4192 domain-containing protein [Nocardioides albertanoniae]TQL69142.1 uncharacterized protein DUF4192 [Nocardioides albertanoniae]
MITKLSITRPEDVLAAVPVLLGFRPERSIVMITFGGDHQVHGRIDLPPPGEVEGCLDTLFLPAVRHGVRGIVLVLYDSGPRFGAKLARRLAERLIEHDIDLSGCLRVEDGRWFDPLGLHGGPPEGVPFQVDDHPFRVQAVYDGHVVRGSRTEVAASIAPIPDAVLETEKAMEQASMMRVYEVSRLVDEAVAGVRLSAEQVAALLVSLRDPQRRDAAWGDMTRTEAKAHVGLWADVVRRSPADHVAHPAAVLALAAWLGGDGALAWCALDRCFASERRHGLGGLVAQLLDGAVPPTAWEEELTWADPA